MNPIKRFFLAAGGTLLGHWETVLDVYAVAPVSNAIHTRITRRLTGSDVTPTGVDRLHSYRQTQQTIAPDGCVLGGTATQAWAKFAIPKGLPAAEGDRRLAIENDPHYVDDFDGIIAEGYGKGTKSLLASETAVFKIEGRTSVGRLNYHFHEADVAGPHYDFCLEGIQPNAGNFEVNIPRGEFKGRYAFTKTDQGHLVARMRDRSVLKPKPEYQLKPVSFLETLGDHPEGFCIERKMDGSLANVVVHKERAIFRSHRETGEPYFDRLPAIEFLDNRSRLWSSRRLFKGPDQDGTVFQAELLHHHGASKTSGILNALPEKARSAQELNGPVRVYVWDIHAYKGQNVSELPYAERRALYESAVRDIRLFNKNWDVVEKCHRNETPQAFYDRVISDPRGLPFSEGVVVKPADASVGNRWIKIKATETEDFVFVSVLSSPPGTKYSDSAAVLVVADPISGREAEVGSFAINDAERKWIWEHRDELSGAVVKIRVLEKTSGGAPRAGVFQGFHGDARSGIGNEMGLQMYSEGLAGGDPIEAERTKFRLKAAAGWRRK